jgi:hypothetical protein
MQFRFQTRRALPKLVAAAALVGACSGNIGTRGSGDARVDDDRGGHGGAGSDERPGTAERPTGGAGPQAGTGGGAAFVCTPAAGPRLGRLRKLTGGQLRATLSDLLASAVGADVAKATLDEAATALAALPADKRQPIPQDQHGAFRRMDQDVQQTQVDALYEVAVRIGAALTRPERIGKLLGSCATDSNAGNDAACLTNFIDEFGARAWRKPLTDADRSFYVDKAYGGPAGVDPAGVADVVAALLSSPRFLYQVEHGEVAVAGHPGTFALDAYELAARLSYQFWDTMPDETLRQAATSGELVTAAGFRKQIDRLLADPRARVTMDAFFADWLKLDDLPAFDQRNADARYKAFAAGALPSAGLRDAIIADARELLGYFTWTKPGSLTDALSTDRSFARSAELARLYGVSTWDGTSDPPAFPASSRHPGLLTRAAFVASASGNTRPVMKGVFIRKSVLCDELPPPPQGVNAVEPLPDGMRTTRQTLEALTEAKGSTCSACHARLINPLGYLTEGYDALGRVRREEVLYDAGGKELGRAPIDATGVPAVVAGDERRAESIDDLLRFIRDSGKADACLARQYVRFTFASWDDPEQDGCMLEELRTTLANGGSLRELLRAIALAPEFAQRRFE